MVVLTERVFRFSLFISQLLAKAIPVRGAKFKKADVARHLLFCFLKPTRLKHKPVVRAVRQLHIQPQFPARRFHIALQRREF